MGEDAVDAGFAHFVVAFWVHEEAHGWVEVAGGFADRADVCGICLSAVAWRREGAGLKDSYHLHLLDAVEQHHCGQALVT